MIEEALEVVKPATGEETLTESRHAYMRYVGQGHEIPVELPLGEYTAEYAIELKDRFEAAYRKLYGRTIEGVEIEVLSWTLTLGSPPAGNPGASTPALESAARFKSATQSLFDPSSSRRHEARVIHRSQLSSAEQVPGPALISEDQTTTVVPPGWIAHTDENNHVVMSRREDDNHG
jgi:N-methylhydantoinase A